MAEEKRPSVHDWPAMAKDLINRASKSPNYGDGKPQPPIQGAFARDDMPPIIVVCTLDVHKQGFKILHISVSLAGNRNAHIPEDILAELLSQFDKNPPYSYRSASNLLHCLWPYPWEDKEAHAYLNESL